MVRGRAGGLFSWLMLLIAALLMIPVVSVLSNVLRAGSGTWQHLSQTVLPEYLFNTVALALCVGIGVPIIGVATAWLVTMCRFPMRRIFEWALILPLAFPAYVMAYTYTDFLQPAGPLQSALRDLTGLSYGDYWFPEVRSLGGAAAMLIMVLYPYVYLLARAAFLEQSVCALEVSRTLGCTAWSSFLRVALPLARPAIVAGTALALMETLADFGTVSFFGIPTFTTGIVRAWVSFGDPVSAAQLSSSLLALVFIVLLLEHWSRRRSRYHHTSSKYQHLPGYRLRGVRRFLAFMACALPLFFGFILPASILVKSSFESAAGQAGGRFFGLVWNTVTLAATTAVLAVLLATLLAYSLRLTPSAVSRLAARLASMGYAVPGTVIAVGVLIPFAAFDNWLDALLGRLFGISTGLLLTGSIAALVFAYLVRFLAVSLNTVEASLGKVKPTMDDAARALGTGPVGTLRRVHIPIMRTSLLTAALVVFVDVMKELPATLVMRPFNFDTLAVRAHNLASDERLSEAGLPSLAIVAVGIPPLILLSRAIAGARPGSRKRP
jgi:iron(III) transport system permease protein